MPIFTSIEASLERPIKGLYACLKAFQSLSIALVLFVATMGVEVPWIDAAFADEGPIQVEGEVAEPVPLVVEAEAAQFFLNSERRRWLRSEAYGRSAISILGSTHVPEPDEQQARLDYDLFFPKAGAYYIWLRGLSHTSPQPIAVGLDGERLELGSGISLDDSGVWKWQGGTDEGRAFVLVGSAGHHRLNLYAPHNAEVHLDRILLTNNAAFIPKSVGPVGNSGRSDWAKVDRLEPATSIVLEAEHYIDRIDRESAYAWQLLAKDNTVTEVSGANGVQTQMREGSAQGGAPSPLEIKKKTELSYTFDAPHKGQYFLWARGKSSSDEANKSSLRGVHLGLNDKVIYKNFTLGFEDQWHWQNTLSRGKKTKAALINIRKAGPQTLHLWGSDTGVAIDKILLTDDVDLLPSGFGPEESAVQSLTPDHTVALEAECSRNWDNGLTHVNQGTQAYFQPNGWLNPLPAHASEGYSIGMRPPLLDAAIDAPEALEGPELYQETEAPSELTLAYDADIAEAGEYTLWVRAYDTGFGKPSVIHAGLEGQSEEKAQTIAAPRAGQWQWVRAEGLAQSKNPKWHFDSAGPYRLQLKIDSPHVLLDKLILSPDPKFTPRGAGPVSPQGGCQDQRIGRQNNGLLARAQAAGGADDREVVVSGNESDGSGSDGDASETSDTEDSDESGTFKPAPRFEPPEFEPVYVTLPDGTTQQLDPFLTQPSDGLREKETVASAVGDSRFQSLVAYAAASPFTAFSDPKEYVPGTLPGEFSVSQHGAATYNIPLELPPGQGDLKPSGLEL